MRWIGLGLCLTMAAASGAQTLISKDGQLTETSTRIKSGEFGALHTFPVKNGQLVSVRLRSQSFAPYLIVTPPGAEQLDAKASNGVAEAYFLAAQDGNVEVIATTGSPGEKGNYQFSATAGLIEGELKPDDKKLETGEFTKLVPVWLPGGKTYTVDAASDRFNIYLIAHVGQSKIEVDDSLGEGTNARAVIRTDQPGVVTLQVTSHKPGEVGAFRVLLTPGLKELHDAASVKGKLVEGDPTQDGKLFSFVSFVAAKGKRYVVTLKAQGTGARLLVVDPGGAKHEAPLPAGEVNSQITFDSPNDGVVQIEVLGTQNGKGGEYELSVAPTTPTVVTGAEATEPDQPPGVQLHI